MSEVSFLANPNPAWLFLLFLMVTTLYAWLLSKPGKKVREKRKHDRSSSTGGN